MKNEQTTVSLVVAGDGIDPSEVTARVGIAPTAERSGIWRLREGGPTSFEAPHVPEALARALLERVGERAGAFASYRERGLSYVRFSLWLPRLLRFSFELSPAIAARLAHTAGEIVFDIRDVSREESPVAFGEGERDRCDVELAISGAALDPDELTAALGVSPTSAQRAGEPVGRAGGRIAIEGRWSLETTCSPE